MPVYLGISLFVGVASNGADSQATSHPIPITLDAPSAPRFVLYDLLTFYKDNYFITGFSKTTEAKFQFSVKFDLWPNQSQHAAYLAYSQKARWNIYQSSAPFLENNYNPELFYTLFHHAGRYQPPPGCSFFSERFGDEHESDGLGGANSRGWNRIFIESRFACYRRPRGYLTVTLKAWAPPFGISDNPDIARYLGYGELAFSIGSDTGKGWGDQWNLTATGRKGTALRAGGVAIDGRWRPPFGELWRFTPFLYAQLFTGYGETLLSYNRALTAFRVGIALTDTSTRSK